MVSHQQNLLEITDFSFSYPNQHKKTLDQLSISLEKGDFAVVFGYSGCGKTTLLRQCTKSLAPFGTSMGEIVFDGMKIDQVEERILVEDIGYVMQNPESQIVTTKVSHELAFSLENLGVEPAQIRRRIGEVVSFFGMGDWYHKDTEKLSGGQKQILNLAAVMTLNPKLLLLDEPTSQLDPVSAINFFQMLKRLNEEMGTTILLSEQRLQEVIPLANRLILLEKGRLLKEGTPGEVMKYLAQQNHPLMVAMPAAVQMYGKNPSDEPCPISIKEGRKWLATQTNRTNRTNRLRENDSTVVGGKVAIQCKEVYFRYEKKDKDVLTDVNGKIFKGSIAVIAGNNGSGKTTLLTLLAGLRKPVTGTIKVEGTVGYLPQNPRCMFLEHSVKKEVEGIDQEKIQRFGLQSLLDQHPFDLSGGEMARLALAKVANLHPDIFLLDEPTKGMDGAFKEELMGYLRDLKKEGKTVVMISHDVEFFAKVADQILFLFDHEIVYQGKKDGFFLDNIFYTTAAARIAHGILDGIITEEDVILQ